MRHYADMRRLGLCLLVAMAAAGMLAVPVSALRHPRVTPRDRAATRGYLEAELAYARARLAAVPASHERDEALARTLGAECAGVLANAPFKTLSALDEPPERIPSARERGEQNRLQRQWGDLQLELGFVLGQAPTAAVREAELSYVHKLRSLHWTNPGLTTLEHHDAEALERELQIAPPALCVDMRAWAASGYQRISPGTKAFEAKLNAALSVAFADLARLGPPLESPLRYAGPRERALEQTLTHLERKQVASLERASALRARIERTLGIPEEHEPQPRQGPPSGAIVIGRGRTAAGSSYTIWAALPGSEAHKGFSCQQVIGVEEFGHGNRGSRRGCATPAHPQPPTVECDEGVLTIEAQTVPRARRVRLTLSDGRQIVSHVAVLPARLGGPAGFYYQAVRGPSPIPVSITELDAHGRTLRKQALEPYKGCVKGKPTFTVGPRRTIVRGGVPQGPPFSIIGERAGEEGATRLELHVEVEGALADEGSATYIAFDARARASARLRAAVTSRVGGFGVQTRTGCRPHEYAILYGVLRDPRDEVLAREGAQTTVFGKARIPAILRARGVLAYLALQSVPSEVLVRSPAGKTVAVEKLTRRAREAKETCEGEAEPPG
jgi:hypothetical protein